MSVTFILGRAGAGKTRWCLDAILGGLGDPRAAARQLFIVPEQAGLQMERTLAARAPRGGYTRAAVLSFSRLAHLALDGRDAASLVSSDQRRLALRRIAIEHADELRALRGAAGFEGFFRELDGLIERLLREGVDAATLQAAAERTGRDDPAAAAKVADIARLYRTYEVWLGPGRTDVAARLALVRAGLDRLDWLRAASVWVDGFAGFTGQELETLTALARATRELTITLLVDPQSPAITDPASMPDPLGLFRRTEQTYQQLRRRFDALGVAVEPPVVLAPARAPRFAATPALAGMESSLLDRFALRSQAAPQPQATGDAVRVIECPTPREELRAAAAWIRTRLADSPGELHWRDFAIIARDVEPYAELVAEVFDEFEIPHFLDRRRPIASHPLCRLVAALLETLASDFDVEPTVRLLRTRLLPLTRDAAEQIENMILRHTVRGEKTWRLPTWSFVDDAGNDPTNRSAAHEGGDRVFAARTRILDAVAPLLALCSRLDPCTGRTFVEAFFAALEALRVGSAVGDWMRSASQSGRIEAAETHRLAWDALCELLDNIHDVLGDTSASPAEWAAVVRSGLADLSVGLAPPTVDQVLVGAIERSRHPDIRCAWIIGFNEGFFPARPADDRVLTVRDRDALVRAGLDALAPQRDDAFDERLLAYIAMTRASDTLVISYAASTADGDELQPSPLLEDLRAVLPDVAIERPDDGALPVTLPALARRYLTVRGDAHGTAEASRLAALVEAVRATPSFGERLARLLRGCDYANAPSPIGQAVRPPGRTGVAWRGSISEIDTFLACPFKHFARHGLSLDPERGPTRPKRELGEDAHTLLAHVVGAAMREAGGVRELSDARWNELFDDAVAAHRAAQPADLLQRRPDLAVQIEHLYVLVRELVLVHAERWRRGVFEPLAVEAEFDPASADAAIHAPSLELADGRVAELRGRIDRLDVARDSGRTLVLAYDYKSSRPESLATARYLTGPRLQLLAYLHAATQTASLGANIEPAGVLVAPLYPDAKALDTVYYAKADAADQRLYLYKPRGVFSEAAAPLLDRALGASASPVAQMRLKQDLTEHIEAQSDARPASVIAALLVAAKGTIRAAVDGLAGGCVDVAPLVEQRTLACHTCEFGALCRFDRAYNRPRRAEAVLPTIDGAEADDEGGDE